MFKKGDRIKRIHDPFVAGHRDSIPVGTVLEVLDVGETDVLVMDLTGMARWRTASYFKSASKLITEL